MSLRMIISCYFAALIVALGSAQSGFAAAPAQIYTACGVTSPIAFKTWSNTLSTMAPLVFPRTETELRDIVRSVSRIPGCKIRVAGTGGSSDGLVVLKQERNVVVVNLADMQVHPDWDYKLDRTKKTARVGAGKSLEEYVGFIRPQGFLPPTRSFARIFTVGGWYMSGGNHGATFASDRSTKEIMGLRVLLANGQYRDITDARTVAEWRGSLGMLGIVVALEVEVMEDQGMLQTMMFRTFEPQAWNRANVTRFVQETAQGADGIHWFFNLWTSTLNALRASNTGNPNFNFTRTAAYYAGQVAKYPILSKFGVPVIEPAQLMVLFPPELSTRDIAAAVSETTQETLRQSWMAATALGSDGYAHSPEALLRVNLLGRHIRCPVDCINDGFFFTALDAVRSSVFGAIGFPLTGDKLWYPTFLLSMRIFTVSNARGMVLENLKPGKYLAFDFDDARGVISQTGYSLVFRRIETFLRQLDSSASPHIGKDYAFDQLGCLDNFYPFQDNEFVERIYPENVKKRFAGLMRRYDPRGLFRAGSVLHMIGMSDETFDPRSLEGQTCGINADCMDGCCCLFAPTCGAAQLLNKCVSCDSPLL